MNQDLFNYTNLHGIRFEFRPRHGSYEIYVENDQGGWAELDCINTEKQDEAVRVILDFKETDRRRFLDAISHRRGCEQ